MASDFAAGLTSRFARLSLSATLLVVFMVLFAWWLNNATMRLIGHIPDGVQAVTALATEIRLLRQEMSGAPSAEDFHDLELTLRTQGKSLDTLSAELAAYQTSLGSIGTLVDRVDRNGRESLAELKLIRDGVRDLPIQVLSVAERKYPTAESRERFNGDPAEPYMDTGRWPEPTWDREPMEAAR